MPRARSGTRRCRFADEDGRCRRIATVDGQLCRSHAVIVHESLEGDPFASDMLDRVDRFLAGRNQNEIVRGVTGILDSILGPRIRRQEQLNQIHEAQMAAVAAALRARIRSAAAARLRTHQRQAPRRPPPPPRPPPDPTLLAREILGIEPDERLTAALVKQRHRALSTVFHPDKPGGSVKRMQKLNRARDMLTEALANRS